MLNFVISMCNIGVYINYTHHINEYSLISGKNQWYQYYLLVLHVYFLFDAIARLMLLKPPINKGVNLILICFATSLPFIIVWPFRSKLHHLVYQFFFMIDLSRSIMGNTLINMMEQGMLSKIL